MVRGDELNSNILVIGYGCDVQFLRVFDDSRGVGEENPFESVESLKEAVHAQVIEDLEATVVLQ